MPKPASNQIAIIGVDISARTRSMLSASTSEARLSCGRNARVARLKLDSQICGLHRRSTMRR